MTRIKLEPHTIYVMVGPSGCGKSTLCEQWVSEQAAAGLKKPKVISSDGWRRHIIGEDLHKYHPQMSEVSTPAFDFLFKELQTAVSYPQSLYNSTIIVDSTGLDKEFRQTLIEVAEKNRYKIRFIVFHYQNRKEYTSHLDDENPSDRKLALNIINRHLSSLNRQVEDIYSHSSYRLQKSAVRLKQHPKTDPVTFDFTQLQNYEEKYKLQEDYNYVVVGDIHCRIDLLIDLIKEHNLFALDEENNIKENPRKILLVINGDYIDKNINTLKETIEWLYRNKDYLIFVLGNHENYVYKVLTNQHVPNREEQETIIPQYFNSISVLKSDPNLLEKFNFLRERTLEFVIHSSFVAHHSPCATKYVGKTDSYSINNQVKCRYPSRDPEKSLFNYGMELMEFLKFDEEPIYRPIVNGHIKVSRVYSEGRILIDIGAEEGYGLAGVLFSRDLNTKYKVLKIIKKSSHNELPDLHSLKKGLEVNSLDVDKDALEAVKRKYMGSLTTPIRYLQPTLPPAGADVSSLEYIGTAMQYYKDRGVFNVVIQLKRMGSNCTLYLYKDLDRCYAISRGGRLINKIDLSSVFQTWQDKVFDLYPNAESVILTGELEPWNLLDIRKEFYGDFYGYYNAALSEHQVLKEHGFYERIAATSELNSPNPNLKSRQTLAKQYIETHTQLWPWEKVIEEEEHALREFKEQLDAYIRPEVEPYFWAFNVLKVDEGNGDEHDLPMNNFDGWVSLNNDSKGIISCRTDQGVRLIIDKIKNWTKECKYLFGLDKIEGVVVKPLDPRLDTVVPGIKVRNEDYLRIVYGYNYPAFLKEKLSTKNSKSKYEASLKQWRYSLNLLKLKKSDLFSDLHASLIYHFLGDEKQAELLDPRL